MLRIRIDEYWERLERHDWFYDGELDDFQSYEDVKMDAYALHAFSRLSFAHEQLYTVYYRIVNAGLVVDYDGQTRVLGTPMANMPEAS